MVDVGANLYFGMELGGPIDALGLAVENRMFALAADLVRIHKMNPTTRCSFRSSPIETLIKSGIQSHH